MNSIAIITTCKGRLAFLKQTLPKMVATGFPVTVVDYDCPEGTGDWVRENFPGVNLVRVKDRPLFNLSEARNLGAEHTQCKAIAFIDSDMLLSDGFAAGVLSLSFANSFFTASPNGRGQLTGQCLVGRQAFDDVGGYDPVMIGWGYEDADLYARLEMRGIASKSLPEGIIAAVTHGDQLRVAFSDQKSQHESHRLNRVYSRIKLDLELVTGRNLSLIERADVRRSVENVFSKLRASPAGSVIPFLIPLRRDSLELTPEYAAEGSYDLGRSLHYTLSLG